MRQNSWEMGGTEHEEASPAALRWQGAIESSPPGDCIDAYVRRSGSALRVSVSGCLKDAGVVGCACDPHGIYDPHWNWPMEVTRFTGGN